MGACPLRAATVPTFSCDPNIGAVVAFFPCNTVCAHMHAHVYVCAYMCKCTCTHTCVHTLEGVRGQLGGVGSFLPCGFQELHLGQLSRQWLYHPPEPSRHPSAAFLITSAVSCLSLYSRETSHFAASRLAKCRFPVFLAPSVVTGMP